MNGWELAWLQRAREKQKDRRAWMHSRRDKHGNLTCEYCGSITSKRKAFSWCSATLDHRTPLSRGGKDEPDNWAVCCNRCNGLKGAMTQPEFEAWRAAKQAAKEERRRAWLAANKQGGTT